VIAVATPALRAAAAALLEDEALPTSDLDSPQVTLLVSCDHGDEVGAALGLEQAGEYGLVRSLVVAPALRGTGLASALYEHLLALARRRRLVALFTLTDTAGAWFRARGFVPVARDAVPAAILATAQFRGLCPTSTAVYTRSLDDG
jgi:amino-acid N-acetyltransferase